MREFELKPIHLKLLQQMNVEWNDVEFGAPEIDPKRPYGNSNVLQDLAEYMGIRAYDKKGLFAVPVGDTIYFIKGEDSANLDFETNEDLSIALELLHKETQTALQIVLSSQSFTPGIYVADDYSNDWRIQ